MDTEENISFEDLGLDELALAAVAKKGFKTPSPIQVLAIPRLLNGDSNMIAKARTGTGKTAAFGLPLIQKVRSESEYVRALILEPTRELAVQTCTEMQSFTTDKFPRTAVVYGGASMGLQIKDLRRGAEIVVGTPGRIKDHIERGTLNIEKIDYFILDEGDEMLDMGFIDDIEAIFAKANPLSRILLFSATMPAPILKIAQKFMGDYEIIEEGGITEEPLLIDQKYWVVRENEKIEALVRLIDMASDFYGLVFTQTKSDADMVSRLLDERGYEAAALHGDIPQSQREKILARFRIKKTRILVATDVAARGIDISGLSHVVNYSLPFDGATYVHRIGRTGRAGTSGCAVTFVRPEERRKLRFLQQAVARASKGEMKEDTIPSIEAVLKVKRERMFTEMKVALGLENPDFAEKSETNETCEKLENACGSVLEGENAVENSEESRADFAESENAAEKKLVPVSPVFEAMAAELCDRLNPQEVLAAVLERTYGKALDKSHYGKISAVKSGRDGRDGRSSNASDQLRLYVQLGRRDGYNPRSIAEFFSSLLNIPGRMVDRIEMSSNFSLVSLPVSCGNRALDLSRSDRSLPHIHVDIKAGDFEGGRRGSRFGGGSSEGRARSEGKGREMRGERFGRKNTFPKGSVRVRNALRSPASKGNNASRYKKNAASADEMF